MNFEGYNVPFLIAKCKDLSLQKVKAKAIITDKVYPTTKSEFQLKAIADSRCYLLHNLSNLIDRSLFIKSYYLLTGKKLIKEKASSLMNIYYQFKNFGLCQLIVELIYQIGKMINFRKTEYALLLMNYFFTREFGFEIRIPQSRYQEIKRMFQSREKVLEIFMFIKQISKPENKQNRHLDINEVLAFFKTNKNNLISAFSIKNLYLFGSYAEGTNHSKSDLDLLVIFDDRMMGMEKILNRKKLLSYLEEQLGVNIDLLFFRDAIEAIDVMSLNNLLAIY